MSALASLDGTIGPSAQARIPVEDGGLLHGDGACELVRLYRGRPLAMEDHYVRLERTCAGLRLEADLAALRAEVTALLAAAGPLEALLRIVLTRGGARIAIVEPLPRRASVARVGTVTYAPDRVLDGLGTTSRAGRALAERAAREAGFDEALLVTPHGRVLEGAAWTFFWVARGELLTPPVSDRILGTTTRARVMEESGAREAVCTLDELAGADEAFLASPVHEVVAIAQVDDAALPAAPGPVTQAAAQALARRIERELSAVPAPA